MGNLTSSDCISLAKSLTEYYPQILPAVDVVQEAARLAPGYFDVQELGTSKNGHVVQLMSEKASGRKNRFGMALPILAKPLGLLVFCA